MGREAFAHGKGGHIFMRLRHTKALIRVAIFLMSTGASGVLDVTAVSGETTVVKALTHYRGNASATIQKGKITNPGVAAQRLYNAWKKRSKKAALKVASSAAVSKLFSIKWRPMKFKGCTNTGGSFECIYRDAGLDLDLAMVIEGGASAGYHVESISFSSEAASLPATRPLVMSAQWLEQFSDLTDGVYEAFKARERTPQL